jgi:hypothetical protein
MLIAEFWLLIEEEAESKASPIQPSAINIQQFQIHHLGSRITVQFTVT